MFLVAVLGLSLGCAGVEPVSVVIERAGNCPGEKARFDLLMKLTQRSVLPAQLSQDLDRLLPVVDWRANGREKYQSLVDAGRTPDIGYLNRFFKEKTRRLQNAPWL